MATQSPAPHSSNEREELPSVPGSLSSQQQQQDSEDITISLGIVHNTIQSIETYLRAQCHLQNFWILSHTVTILGTILYASALASGSAPLQQHSYALTTWGTIITYIIVLYRCNIDEQVVVNEEKEEVILKPMVKCVSEFMKNENAQLLGYICLWLFTDPSIVKLLPFAIYSTINLSSFFTLELIPDSPFSNALLPLLNYFEIPLLTLASHFDLVAIVLLFRESLLYNNAYPLVIYMAIWSLRYENSEISRSSLKYIITTVDNVVLSSFVPNRLQSEYRLARQYLTLMIPLEESVPSQTPPTGEKNKDEQGEDYQDLDYEQDYEPRGRQGYEQFHS